VRLRRLIALGALLALAGCAGQTLIEPGARGFFWGMFDGAVAPFAFIVSLFNSEVRIYAYPNSGLWYDFGFLLGLCLWAGGSRASKRGSE
jgi:hypothetical protein